MLGKCLTYSKHPINFSHYYFFALSIELILNSQLHTMYPASTLLDAVLIKIPQWVPTAEK